MQLYIFGNGSLSLSRFLEHYHRPLEALDPSGVRFLVCDFRGVDTLAMEYLKDRTAAVTILHVGERPRYLPDRYRTKVSGWTLRGGFASDAARDHAAIDACSHFLAFDQHADRISGTGRNIARCLALGKRPLRLSGG